jgi:hypothetical protein
MIDRLTARTRSAFVLLPLPWLPGYDEAQLWLHALVAEYSDADQ